MSDQPAPHPQPSRGGWMKAALLGLLGLGGGAAGTYATAVVDRIAKPPRPVANFAVTVDGLSVTCQNHATGDNGWWDFGDGTPLEPFGADQTELKHAYAKPGNYTVKLTVRNYFADENERSVPVEVAAGPKDPSGNPEITGFAVQPVSGSSFAPATFRLTAQVKNADSCVWDFGDGRVEVTDGGAIDRLVTFDKPGHYPVQLLAHNAKQGAKQVAAVRVDAAADGSLLVVLKVTDTGTRADRMAVTESVAVPAPAGKSPPPGFSKSVAARPGYAIADAAPAKPDLPGVKNLKVAVSPDRRSAVVSGEWAGDPKAGKGAGSDLIVPLKLTEEKPAPPVTLVSVVTGMPTAPAAAAPAAVSPAGYNPRPSEAARLDLALPAVPPGLTGHARNYQIELRQVGRPQPLLQVPAAGTGSVALPWSGMFALDGRNYLLSATPAADGKVVVTVANLPK